MARELSAQKRETFLRTALKLFVARGLQHTSTAEIARAAGTAAGTLFLYFPTKQHLIDALTLKIGKAQSDYIKSLLDPSLSVHDTFATIWNGSVQWFLQDMDTYHFVQQIRDSGQVTEAVVMESGAFFDFYYSAIQRGIAEGCIKAYPVDLIGGFLYQDVVAVMNHIRLERDPEKQANSIRQGFDLFWEGITVKQ